MGILSFREFSQIPNLFKKIQFRTREREKAESRIPTDFTSFLINNGVRVVRQDTALNAEITLYTVPANKVFYLVAATLSHGSLATGSKTSSLFISTGAETFMSMTTSEVVSLVDHTVYVFPIVLKAEENIVIKSSALSLLSNGSIVGYELDIKSEKQRF